MYNKVILVGRLTADPELRYTNNGVPVCKYCLAVDRGYKDSEGNKTCDFINTVSWKKTAETSEKYLKKGKPVLVEGRMETRKWQTQEGETRYSTEVNVMNMTMLPDGKKGDGGQWAGMETQAEGSLPKAKDNTEEFENVDFSDVPF